MSEVMITRKYVLMENSNYGNSVEIDKFDNQEDLWDYMKTIAAPKDLMGAAPEYWVKDLFIPVKT